MGSPKGSGNMIEYVRKQHIHRWGQEEGLSIWEITCWFGEVEPAEQAVRKTCICGIGFGMLDRSLTFYPLHHHGGSL